MNKKIDLVATTAFGIESVLKNELFNLGITDIDVENGKITYRTNINDIAKCNINLRTADRVYIRLGEFKAQTFDELFDNLYKINFEDFLPQKANFIINAKTQKSKLFSVRTIQSVSEKAIIKKLQTKYNINYFEKTFSKYSIDISILNDIVTVLLDTSGVGLHKRRYRIKQSIAPIKETLAAAMVLLSYYNSNRLLVDLFCGSSTIGIEAALIANNIAPNINRNFIYEEWGILDNKITLQEREQAKSKILNNKLNIICNDIDKKMIEISKQNAKIAGVDKNIIFTNKDFKDFKLENSDYGIVITNPPYGERLEDKEKVIQINKELSKKFKNLDNWSLYLITSDDFFEKGFNKKADKKRKLYNGTIKVDYYQYYGNKPK